MAEEAVETVSTLKPRNPTQIPSPRSGHRCVADDRSVYVFGGYSPHYKEKLFRELWRFNVSTKCWSLLATTGSFPTEVCSSCVVLDRGNLIVYGGSGIPFGQSNSSKLHICILSKREWIEVETTDIDSERDSEPEEDEYPSLPIPGYGQSMVLSPDKQLYVFAGTTGHMFNCYLSRFSFVKKDWKYLRSDNPPFPRYRHEAVSYKDRFFVIGGGMGSGDPEAFYNLNKVHSFHYTNQTWQEHNCLPSTVHGLPSRRRCHGCVIFRDAVYICGGYDGVSMFDDLWSLDLVTFQWNKLPKVLPYPVYFHSAAVTPSGCMYIFGGVKSLDAESDTRSNDILHVWLTIPTLLHISLQAIVSCIPDIGQISVTKFAELGIPGHLVT